MRYKTEGGFTFTSESTVKGFAKDGTLGKLSLKGDIFGLKLDKLQLKNDAIVLEASREVSESLGVSCNPTFTPSGDEGHVAELPLGVSYGAGRLAAGAEVDLVGDGLPASASASLALTSALTVGASIATEDRTLGAGAVLTSGSFTLGLTAEKLAELSEDGAGVSGPSELQLGAAYELPGGVTTALMATVPLPKLALDDPVFGASCTFGPTTLKMKLDSDAVSLACVHKVAKGISVNPAVSCAFAAGSRPSFGCQLNLG